MRTNSRAAPSETLKGGGVQRYRPLPFDVSAMRKTFGHNARFYRQEATTLYDSPIKKFHFPSNQDASACAFWQRNMIIVGD